MPQGTNERPLVAADGWYIVDDYISNDSVADAAVGQLGWELVTIGNASTLAYQTARAGGVLRMTTANTADGDGAVLRSFTDGLVFGAGGGGISTRVRLVTTLAGNNFRIGLDDSVTATEPTVGIWIDSDAGVLSLQVDSADHGDESASAAAGSTLTGGTTMVVDTWHVIKVVWSGANGQGGPRYVEMFVDDDPVASCFCNIDDDEEVELKICHWQDTGGAAARIFEIDYYETWMWVNR